MASFRCYHIHDTFSNGLMEFFPVSKPASILPQSFVLVVYVGELKEKLWRHKKKLNSWWFSKVVMFKQVWYTLYEMMPHLTTDRTPCFMSCLFCWCSIFWIYHRISAEVNYQKSVWGFVRSEYAWNSLIVRHVCILWLYLSELIYST